MDMVKTYERGGVIITLQGEDDYIESALTKRGYSLLVSAPIEELLEEEKPAPKKRKKAKK